MGGRHARKFPGSGADLAAAAAPALQLFHAGDRAAAVDTFLRSVCGPGYRAVVERVLPAGALAQAGADADTFFGVEMPAVRQWTLLPEDAARVGHPVLSVLGGDSDAVTPAFRERHEVLLHWLPRAEPFVLSGATHLLHLQEPRALAEALAGFFDRHPE